MAKKSSDDDAAFRWAREWETRSREQLLEREERETQEGKQSTEKRRQVANRIVAEYRAAIAERGRAKWDQPRSKEPEWHRFSDEELFAIYGRREDYDAHDDVAKSFDEAYRVIRERMANGGPGWEPK